MRRLALLLLVAGCGHKDAPAVPATPPPVEAITRTTDGGPVKATVSLAPAKPRLGDRLTLTLTVDAAAGVTVLMPAFGDALGRFAIVEFVPGAPKPLEGGGTRTLQRYTLESPPSGRHRIPSLRLEVSDERQDAGPGTRELLTEEIPVEVASVLGDARKDAELRPARGPLSEAAPRGPLRRFWPLIAAAPLLLVAAFLLWRAARRRAAERARVNAFDVAMGRLAKLQGRGFPRPEEADGWYVELSGIVRRYIEDRFAIRAPELTTEEFLQVAGRASALGDTHASRLSQFLASCDRVKFAAYKPDDKESAEAMGSARRFLEETRLVAEPPERRAA